MKSRLKWPFISVFACTIIVIAAGILDRPTIKTFVADVQEASVQ